MDKYQETIATWNKIATLYEEKFMNFSLYNDTYQLFCLLITQKEPKILEIGCGPGNITKHLLQLRPDFILDGIDVSFNMIQLAQKNNPNASFRVYDARHLAQIKECYDAIVCGFCIPYLIPADVENFITASADLLTSKGQLYLSFISGNPDSSGFITSSSGDKTYFHFYETAFIKRLLQQNHFVITNEIIKEYTRSESITEQHIILIAAK